MNREEIDLLESVFTLAIGECAYNDINNIQKLEDKIKTIGNLCKKQKEVIKDLSKENQSLKEQLEENKDKINWYENFEINKTIDKLRLKHNNQQKEFIEYMNKTIEELECDDVDDEEMKGYLIQRIDTFKEILQKYKSIIGGKDAIK